MLEEEARHGGHHHYLVIFVDRGVVGDRTPHDPVLRSKKHCVGGRSDRE